MLAPTQNRSCVPPNVGIMDDYGVLLANKACFPLDNIITPNTQLFVSMFTAYPSCTQIEAASIKLCILKFSVTSVVSVPTRWSRNRRTSYVLSKKCDHFLCCIFARSYQSAQYTPPLSAVHELIKYITNPHVVIGLLSKCHRRTSVLKCLICLDPGYSFFPMLLQFFVVLLTSRGRRYCATNFYLKP
jgi:hypothetical protein